MTETKIKKLSNDDVFKAVYSKCQSVFLRMIKDFFDIEEDIRIDKVDVIPGYELEPLRIKNKTFVTEVIVKLSDNSFINIAYMNNCNKNDILSCNALQMYRLYASNVKEGTTVKELSEMNVSQLNFNTFEGFTGRPIETIALCGTERGKIVSKILTICNVDIVKCEETMHNVDVRDTPRKMRWGAIHRAETLEEIDRILDEDMISMEEKENFLNVIREVTDDSGIVPRWGAKDNARLKYECEMEGARKEGLAEGQTIKELELITNMLKAQLDYQSISQISGKSIEEIKALAEELSL